MNFVDVNRPGSAAFGTNATPKLFDFAFEDFRDDVCGEPQDAGVLVALVIAITRGVVARPHPANNND